MFKTHDKVIQLQQIICTSTAMIRQRECLSSKQFPKTLKLLLTADIDKNPFIFTLK